MSNMNGKNKISRTYSNKTWTAQQSNMEDHLLTKLQYITNNINPQPDTAAA